jgi:LTXXQ motif family protein
MRKALLPLVASLALCGTATAVLIATNARAEQSAQRPAMIALLNQGEMAAPSSEGGPPPDMQNRMMMDIGARRGQFCKDMYAHKAGELAFLEAKLSLSANQEPLFARWKQASLDIAKQRESSCTTRDHRADRSERRNVVQRLAMEEDHLKKRLADIEAERPALTAFYGSLTPAQKEEFGRGQMRRTGERMHMMMGMMGRHPGMGPGMGRGPMDRGAMGEAPPPAQ